METLRYANNSDSQVMDFYRPDAAGKVPVIVLVHGGAFLFGDQKMNLIRPIIDISLANGFAVASVDYRKTKEAVFPASLADIKASVRYLKSHADELEIYPEKITVWGESAGGYLSLMTALTPAVDTLNGDIKDNHSYDSCVSALVVFYPPVEFYTMRDEYRSWGDTEHGDGKFESMYLGIKNIYTDEASCRKTHWLSYIGSLPEDFKLDAWIQVGDENDIMVPYKQAENFANRLASLQGVNVHYEQIPGGHHEDPAFYTEENLNTVLSWLKSALGEEY